MRFSLFIAADRMPATIRERAYGDVENQVIAAELNSFNAVWLEAAWTGHGSQIPATFRVLQNLTNSTDRVDLGVYTALPPVHQHKRLVDELARLDDLSGGRARLILDLGNDPSAAHIEAGLGIVQGLGKRICVERSTRPADRLRLVAYEITAGLAGQYGLGLALQTNSNVHTRRLQLANYHQVAEAGRSWVSRFVSTTVAANLNDLTAVQYMRAFARSGARADQSDAWVEGLPQQVTAQLAALQLADGLDEFICDPVQAGTRPEAALRSIELLGSVVLPSLQEQEQPLALIS